MTQKPLKAKHTRSSRPFRSRLSKAGVQCDSQPIMLDALDRYNKTKLDIVDCLLAARAVVADTAVATFYVDIGKEFADV